MPSHRVLSILSDAHPLASVFAMPANPSRMLSTVHRLPVDAYRGDFLGKVHSSDVMLALAETGAGKTTRLPQFILDDAQSRCVPCRTAVTQPCRIAAISIGKQVASERGERFCEGTSGDTSVCSADRGESKLPYATDSVTYLTEDLLVATFDRGGYLHIMLDDVHERTLNIDTLMCLWRQAQASGKCYPKLISLSAKFAPAFFRDFFTGPLSDSVATCPISPSNGNMLPTRITSVLTLRNVLTAALHDPLVSAGQRATLLADAFLFGDFTLMVLQAFHSQTTSALSQWIALKQWSSMQFHFFFPSMVKAMS